jgi:Helix-turn-helix domain
MAAVSLGTMAGRSKRASSGANATMSACDISYKPLLSVDEVAVLLGTSRASNYRSIERGDLPLPVFTINGRLKIARRAVERLLSGEAPISCKEGVVKGGGAGERSERTLDDPDRESLRQSQLEPAPACGRTSRFFSRAGSPRAQRPGDPPRQRRRCSVQPCARSTIRGGPACAPR